MKSRFHRAGALLLAAALSLSVLAGAQAQGRGRGNVGPVPQPLLAKLNLTEEQQPKVKAANEALQAELQKAGALTDMREQRMARRQAGQKYEAALREALTPDQQQKLEQLRMEAAQYQGLGPMAANLVGLDLSDEQKTKIKEVIAKHQPELQKLRASQREATDKAAVQAQIREATQKMTGEVRALLTPEQQQKIRPARNNQDAK